MSETTKQVYKSIAAITKSLSREGISKDRKNQQQGYQFRGIDDVLNTLSNLLAEHNLCILPKVESRECVERQSQKGSTLFYTVVRVSYDFVSALDGSSHQVVTYGEAMDSADKSTNKAMSAAYKYAAIQAFCIPTEGDNDADATTHEVAPTPKPKARSRSADVPSRPPEQALAELNEKLSSAGVTPAEFLAKLIEWKKIDSSIPELQFVPAGVIEASLVHWESTLKALKK